MNSNRARLTASVVASVMFLAGGARAESLRFADDDALDGGDGLSWMTAYNDLQDALGDAGDPNAGVTEIRVAGGIYVPSLRMDPNDPRTATFLLLDSVALRGGYAGLGDPNAPNVRNIALHESVLSGDLAGDDGPNFANYQENSYHVVTALGVSPSAVLDGFTVSGGSASDESYPAAYGGGLYCEGASPTVCDCTFKRNMGQFGAAMFNYQSCPTLTRCTLRDNWCIHYGGAICNWQDSSPELTDCLIRDNRAERQLRRLHTGRIAGRACSYERRDAARSAHR